VITLAQIAGFLVRNWRLVLVGVVVGGVVLVGATWRIEAIRARAEAEARRVELEIANANVQRLEGELADARAERARVVAELERQQAATVERARRFNEVRRTVNAAPATSVCVESPAVRRALDELRTRSAAPGRE
jgi:hypothetical protein